jgi:YegS/Rv2252/BmrU family lipid kinase
MAEEMGKVLEENNVAYSLCTASWPTEWDDFSEAWIVGGDGTLNYFINQYPDFHLPISIFKGGTGNDFHWMLYGKLSIEQQVKNLLIGRIKQIDAGLCNGKLFLNGLGIGFDGAVVKELRGKKKLRGKISYYLTVLKNILRYREQEFSFAFENILIQKKCFLISVANGIRYGGGFKVAPKALINDGLLDLNIVHAISPLNRIKYLPSIEKGKHVNLPFIDYRQIQKVLITTTLPAHAQMDGEYFSADTFEVSCLPEKFAFLV